MQVQPEHAEHAERFLPHGYCYLWDQPLLWTHIVSDVLIGMAYVAISCTLVWLVMKGRREFPFQWMFLAFGLFIVACGATHFIEVWTLWNPDYWFSAGIKAVTAAASVGTAILLPPLAPQALRTARDARLSEERRVMAERAAALAESEARFRTLAESMPQIAWTAGPDGAVDYYNRRWFEFTGITTTGGHGWGWQGVLHPDDEARTVAAWTASVATGEPYEVEHRLRTADGSYRWVLSRGLPARDAGGAITRWLGTATDIHQQVEAAEELRRARDAAQAGSRARDQFMAVMSHELRTPLNAIMGYADLMASGISGPTSPKQDEHLDRIRASSAHLVGVIDQILSFARDEAGHTAPRPEAVPAGAVLRDAASLAEPMARAKGLELAVEVPPDGAQVVTDPGMLRQIVVNLLSNAVKFTEHGRVSLSARVEGGELWLEVADTGVGVAPEHRERVFEPFWQADQSLTRRAEGTGLGLAVTRRLVLALGGEVAVDSTPGQGSRFTVRIPVAAAIVDLAPRPAAGHEEAAA
jgi:PAS domain S-box-containing protein